MVSEKDKERLKEIDKQLEAGADTLLDKLAASPYSWGIVLATHAVAFVAGAWIF